MKRNYVALYKKCNGCKTIKFKDDFYKRPNHNGSNTVYFMPICKECSLDKSGKYQRESLRYKITKKKYAQSEKGKDVQSKGYKKYSKTEKGKLKIRENNRRFRNTQHGKLCDKLYEALPKTRLKRALYKKTENGKVAASNYNHRRRMVTKNGRISIIFWDYIRDLYDNKCAYCGSEDELTMDHVKPISRGGLHISGNILPACAFCNNSKGAKILSEWRPSLCQIMLAKK